MSDRHPNLIFKHKEGNNVAGQKNTFIDLVKWNSGWCQELPSNADGQLSSEVSSALSSLEENRNNCSSFLVMLNSLLGRGSLKSPLVSSLKPFRILRNTSRGRFFLPENLTKLLGVRVLEVMNRMTDRPFGINAIQDKKCSGTMYYKKIFDLQTEMRRLTSQMLISCAASSMAYRRNAHLCQLHRMTKV